MYGYICGYIPLWLIKTITTFVTQPPKYGSTVTEYKSTVAIVLCVNYGG